MQRKAVKITIISIFIAVACISLITGAFFNIYNKVDFDPQRLSKGPGLCGTIFTDRYGRELRFLPDESGERCRWVSITEIPEAVKNAFIAAEDSRFYDHSGFDTAAILRAAWDNFKNQRIVSGASTISQQVIRLAHPSDERRGYKKKLIEIIRGIKLERSLSKAEILEQYLNRVPMGNNLRGVDMASRAYFGKPLKNLSYAEAAFLAAIPKAPGILNPYGKNLSKLIDRKEWTLRRMEGLGMLTHEKYLLSRDERPAFKKLLFNTKAPHLINQLTSRSASGNVVKTTLDLDLQRRVQQILASHRERLRYRGATQAAAIVIHNPSMEALATVGSLEYSEKNEGYNNGVLSPRSAGSALKPFLYGLAIESGYAVTTLLEDTERKYRSSKGQYAPDNYDRKQYGPVTLRTALGSSLNLSAVKMLSIVGEENFYNTLLRMGLINDQEKGPNYYGLGLAIGNPEVTLEQLAAAYAMLANGGVLRPVRYLLDKEKEPNRRAIFLPQTAYIITNILSDPAARMLTFARSRVMNLPFPVAMKTGTSTFYRDLWTIGYTPDYTVAVWVGNFDGSSTEKMSGVAAAAPVFSEIMNHLYRESAPTPFKKPKGIEWATVCGYSGMKPSEYCTHTITQPFITGTGPASVCTFHTKDNTNHQLSAPYAAWLFEKNSAGFAGRYRLSGFGENLDMIFYDPWQGLPANSSQTAVRIKNANNMIVSDAKERQRPAQSAVLHYSINADNPISTPQTAYSGKNNITIIYPLDRDSFVLNKYEENQVVKFQAITAQPVPYVDWFINGNHYKRTGPPYQAYWPLEPGAYRVSAVDPSQNGDSVRIKVE